MKTQEYLKKNQPIFYRILEQSFQHHNVSHAYLLVGNETKYAATYLAQSLICTNETLACEDCVNCQRIKNHNYPDYIYYDGNEASIKKEDVERIQREFNKSSLEGGAKIYVLVHIEKASIVAINTLLKFLEEPANDVYAILTTNNLSKVLPTIQSRCQIIHLLDESKESIQYSLLNDGVDEEDASLASHLFASYNECKDIVKSEAFMNLKISAMNFVEDIYKNTGNLLLNFQIKTMQDIKGDKKQLHLLLNMIILTLRDMFHVKHSLDLVYKKHEEFFKQLPEDPYIIEKIEYIMDILSLLETNVNISLLMDSMCYHLMKGEKNGKISSRTL